MTEKEYRYIENFFRKHIASFPVKSSTVKKNFDLKTDHTERVLKNMQNLLACTDLKDTDYYTACSSALLHDIGRYTQFYKYSTFMDKKSVNHGELGSEIILANLNSGKINSRDLKITAETVKYHNAKDIPETTDQDSLIYLKLLRDSDKLDIYKLLSEYYSTCDNSNPSINHNLPEGRVPADNVVRSTEQSRTADIKDIESVLDFKILQLSWVFDINFSYTMKKILEFNYLETIINTIEPTPLLCRVFSHIKNFAEEKIQNL